MLMIPDPIRPRCPRPRAGAGILLLAAALLALGTACRPASSDRSDRRGAKRGSDRAAKPAKAGGDDRLVADRTGAASRARTLDDDDGTSPPARVLGAAILTIADKYVAPDRIDPAKMLRRALEFIEAERPELRLSPAEDLRSVVVHVGDEVRRFDLPTPPTVSLLYTHLKEILNHVKATLERRGGVTAKDLAELEYAAVNGLLSTLDPHSNLMPPKLYDEMQIRTEGSFGGIGIVISIRDGALTVISAIDGTPAARHGLKAGDRIVKIEDESTVNLPLDEAVSRLRGPAGTPVAFWVEREGWPEARRITVTRERIEIKSVSSRALPGNIGYVRINRFSHNTLEELKTHLQDLGRRASRGLILDLWNNPGGLLQQSVEVANAFLADGDIVITEGARGSVLNVRKAQPDKLLYPGPMVVLVNEGAASASEIVAGALKNLGRAVVMGETTFGKGTVQMLFENPDQSALKLTVAQYLTPGNVSIQTVGIVPDVFTNAVIVRKDWTRVHGFELDDRRRAKRQDLRPARSQVPQRPAVRLDFLGAESADAAKPLVAGETENAADPPLVELARTFLVRHAGPREEMLRRGQPFLQAWGVAQDRLVLQALAGRGVDWTPAPAGAAAVPAAEVEARLEVGDRPVTAGAPFTLRLTVTNRSASPVYRVHAFTESPGHWLDERELLVGRLGPGETRTVSLGLKVPETTLASITPVTVALRGANLGQGATARARLAVVGLPRPRLTLTYRLHDDVKGNGDGRPEPGETVRLRVALRNTGDGELTAGTVALRNLAGKAVFIEKGRFTVKQLAPGQTEEGDLTFRIQDGAKGQTLRLELSAFDGRLREGVQGQLDLPLAPASATAPGLVGDLTPPRVTVAAPPLEVPPGTRSLTLSGEAVDETQVADLYLEVTNLEAEKFRQKQYYTSAPQGERRTRLPFRATVRLWPGLNTVLVVARERGEILGYQRLMILAP